MKFIKTQYIWIFLILSLLISIIICIIYTNIKEHFLQKDPKLKEIQEKCKDVHPIISKVKLYKSDKSYTINKKKVHLCLKDENGEYYPDNMLIYVFLHEIAHCINKKDIGHTEEWNRIFNELKDIAAALGIWDPNIPVVDNYCGVKHN